MAKTSPIDQNTDPSIDTRERESPLPPRHAGAKSVSSPPPVMSAEEKDTAVAAGRRKGEGKRNWHRYRKRDRNHDEQELGGEGRR